jgi:DNA-binding XRE family transcriptional regulator
MIYFIQNTETKHIKIGYSDNVRSRLSDLQISSPHELAILTICEGGIEVEKELHDKFNDHYVRGEWFNPSEELISYINEFKTYIGLRKLRRDKKMTMEEVGKIMSISKQGVSDLEDRYDEGRITINNLRTYLSAIGYNMDIVFTPQ